MGARDTVAAVLGRPWIAAFFGVTLASSAALAQSPKPAPDTIAVGDFQLAPEVDIRTRGEYRRDPPNFGGLDLYGRLSPRVRDAWAVSERARLGLGVTRGAVGGKITLQDARALGSPSPSATFAGAPGVGRFQPYEAFLEVRSSSARPSWLRLGRQAVVWGEGRLLGKADFSTFGRSLDAARGHLSLGDVDVEALAAILEAPGPLGPAFGDTAGGSHSGVQLYGALGRWTVLPLLRFEAFALARVSRSAGGALDGSRFQAARLSGETYTGVLRVAGEGKGWSYGVMGAYQLGQSTSLAVGGTDVRAWAAAAHVAKTLSEVRLTPTFRLAASYASGDGGDGGAYTQFDPLLADPQRFHGQMDLFAWSNMADASARAEIVPWTDTSFGLEYRYARLAEAQGEWIGSYLTTIGSAAPPLGAVGAPPPGPPSTATSLGHELDVVFAWRPWLPLELRAGWSGMILGDAARAVMAAEARGRREPDGSITPARLAEYVYAQARLTMP